MNRREPGYLLREYFRLRAEVSAVPSALGAMLARAKRYGKQRRGAGGIKVREEKGGDGSRAYERLADLALSVGTLTPAEEEIAALRFWHPADGHEVYTRNVPADDVIAVEVGEGENPPHSLMTRAGEEYVGAATEYKPDGTGASVEGRAVVRGVRAKLTSYETIAKRTGRSEREVKAVLREVAERIGERAERTSGG